MRGRDGVDRRRCARDRDAVILQCYGGTTRVENEDLEFVIAHLRQGQFNGGTVLERLPTSTPTRPQAIDLEFAACGPGTLGLHQQLGFRSEEPTSKLQSLMRLA